MLDVLAVLVATVTLTAYQPVANQTDTSPTWTSIGDMTTKYGVAVSQDMLRDGRIKYGDAVYIEGYGVRIVNDCMNKRHHNRMDLLVFTYKEEKAVGVRHNVKIWRLVYEQKETPTGASRDRR